MSKNIWTRHNEKRGDFQRSSSIVRTVNCRTCVENNEKNNEATFVMSLKKSRKNGVRWKTEGEI